MSIPLTENGTKATKLKIKCGQLMDDRDKFPVGSKEYNELTKQIEDIKKQRKELAEICKKEFIEWCKKRNNG